MSPVTPLSQPYCLLKGLGRVKSGPGIGPEWKLMGTRGSVCFVPSCMSSTQNCAWVPDMLSIYLWGDSIAREAQQKCPFPGIFWNIC